MSTERKFTIEVLIDGKVKCKLQKTDGNFAYCSENIRSCNYAFTTASHQGLDDKLVYKEFCLCLFNCNEWLRSEYGT